MLKILFSIILITGFHSPGSTYHVPDTSIIRYGDLSFSTNKVLKTSQGLFSLLNYDIISHDPGKMRGYTGVVLPLKTKIRLFGDNPALGKMIKVDSVKMEIIGVIKDIPEKSYLFCDLIILSSEKKMSPVNLNNVRCVIIL